MLVKVNGITDTYRKVFKERETVTFTESAPPASTTTVLLHVGTHRSAAGNGECARFRLVAAARTGAGPNRVTPVGNGKRDRGTGRKRRRANAADRNVDPGGA